MKIFQFFISNLFTWYFFSMGPSRVFPYSKNSTTFLDSGELCRANMSPFVNLSIGARSDLLDQLEHSRRIFQGGEVHIVEPGHSEQNLKFDLFRSLKKKFLFWGCWKWHLHPIYETQKSRFCLMRGSEKVWNFQYEKLIIFISKWL